MPVSIKHLRQLKAMPDAPMVLFALWEGDQLYYQVDLVKLDEKNFKATVRFDDKSEHKLKSSQLHIQFNANDFPYSTNEEIVCCVCEGGDSEEPNNLVLCDVCQQGYHQECHQPKLSAKDIESDEWSCNTCDQILKQSRPKIQSSTPKPGVAKPHKMKVSIKPIRPVKQLPVEIIEADEAIHAVVKAIVTTEELMDSIAKSSQEQVDEEKDNGKKKKKKAIKGTKAKKIPQPA